MPWPTAASGLPAMRRKKPAGGSVYDALVGAAAAEHRLPLATRDRRAIDTYRSLNVALEILG